MNKVINKLFCKYRVVKHYSEQKHFSLPSMLQYFLIGENNQPLSFWNDVSLKMEKDIITCGIEVPKDNNRKFQIQKNTLYHPVMQDTKINAVTSNVELRYYPQYSLFNYGFIPQTWEQNINADAEGYFGDNDPVDICDLSSKPMPIGQLYRAKVLGSFCLLDDGEKDWKVLVMEEQQCKQKYINDFKDIDQARISSILSYFQQILSTYKDPQESQILYDGKIFSKEESLQLIYESHKEWKKLLHSSEQQRRTVREEYHMRKVLEVIQIQ